MTNDFLKERPGLRKLIRYGEIVVVTMLLIYAALIYRDLKMLRAAPVVLPAYWLNAATEAGQVQLGFVLSPMGVKCASRATISTVVRILANN